MTVYILIISGSDNILGVYDSELLAMKQKLYFESVYKNEKVKIVQERMEYMDRD